MKSASQISEEVLEKTSGLKEFARYALTGRSTAYHGTSPARAALIRSEGLIPRKSPGVVDALLDAGAPDPTKGENLAFLARSRPMAKEYAGQQAFIDRVGTTPQLFSAQVGWDVMQQPSMRDKVVKGVKAYGKYHLGLWDMLRARNPGTVTARYPARNFVPQRNPEIDVMADKITAAGVPKAVSGILGKAPFISTFGLKAPVSGGAAMPASYIKGSPHYQHTTRPEIMAHLDDVRQNPGRNAREALHNLLGL